MTRLRVGAVLVLWLVLGAVLLVPAWEWATPGPLVVRVERVTRVEPLRAAPGGVILAGTIANHGERRVFVPGSAFVFVDSSGQRYQTEATGVWLAPGARANLTLFAPVPDARGVTLDVDIPFVPATETTVVWEAK
jgi:hypothetical protein